MERPEHYRDDTGGGGEGHDEGARAPWTLAKPLPVPPPRRQREASAHTIIDLPECGAALRRRNTGTSSGSDDVERGWSSTESGDSTSLVTTSTSTASSESAGRYEEAGGPAPGVVERHHHHHYYYVPASEGGDALIDPQFVPLMPMEGRGRGEARTAPIIEEYEDGSEEDEEYEGGAAPEGWEFLAAGQDYGAGAGGGTVERVVDEFYRRHPGLKPAGSTWANPIPGTAYRIPSLENNCAWFCSCVLYCGVLFILGICALIFAGVLTFSQVFGDPW